MGDVCTPRLRDAAPPLVRGRLCCGDPAAPLVATAAAAAAGLRSSLAVEGLPPAAGLSTCFMGGPPAQSPLGMGIPLPLMPNE